MKTWYLSCKCGQSPVILVLFSGIPLFHVNLLKKHVKLVDGPSKNVLVLSGFHVVYFVLKMQNTVYWHDRDHWILFVVGGFSG